MIEDYWYDVSIYLVRFETKKKLMVNKFLVFPASLTIKEIEKLTFSKFKDVKNVEHIDEWADGLLLK